MMSREAKHTPYEGLTDLLAARVPELREQIDAVRHLSEADVPGQHVVYGDILVPYLVTLLKASYDAEDLQELFALIEELAKNPDVHVQEVVAYTILEGLLGESLLAKARPFFGPATLALSTDVEEFWARVRAAQDQKPSGLDRD